MKNLKISQSITDRKDASLGIYFKDVSKLSMITPEEEIELSRRIKEGDKKAEEKLVTANLRFVISVAKQYQNKGLDLVDLIQEGNFGMLQAARKFDANKGFRFISYAVWWIRQAITKAISDQCRTVRVPMNQIVCMGKVNKATEKFEQENGRSPSMIELEDSTNLNPEKISLSLAASNRSVSLESPIHNDEEASCLLDIIPNGSEPADEAVSKKDIPIAVEKALGCLSNREHDVIRMFFGIGMYPIPNVEIAKRFGIGGERVRQILHTALDKMRNIYGEELKELLE